MDASQTIYSGPKPAENDRFVSFRQKGAGRLGAVLVILSITLGLATFSILTGLTPISPSPRVIFWLLIVNGVLLLALALLIGWQLWLLLLARHRKVPGAILHARIVGMFSVFAALPAITIAFFASVTLDKGLDSWFSERTRSILQTSQQVARAYIEEQQDLVRGDVTGIAQNITQTRNLFENNRQIFLRQLETLVSLRNLSGAFVIDRDKDKIEASVTVSRELGYRSPDKTDFKKAAAGEVVIIGPGTGNVIRGLYKIAGFKNHYLYVYRVINPKITSKLAQAQDDKSQYDLMLEQRTGLQVTFAIMYVGVALIFLLAAVWFGMWFADRMVEPIVALVRGARLVSEGHLGTKVKVSEGTGDIATLGLTFNQMTDQLETQRDELILTNHELDERRRFSEAVMAGVSSGVVGVDPDGIITLVNRSALKLLNRRQSSLKGKKFKDVLPEMVPFLEQAENKVSGRAEGNTTLLVDKQDRNFVIQVTTESTAEDEHGVVVTFDDISDLVAAQRNSAWADIARRIAHEIKNPLTPIQLAAERLKRKYQREIVSNPEVFEKCTETIVRQVGDIRDMVDEFSSFARMPSAVLETTDLVTIARDALVLQKASFEDVHFVTDIVDEHIELAIDRRLVTQAITNLVKNAKEAIEARQEKRPEPPAQITLSIRQNDAEVTLSVIDNGKGLPQENRARLTEPYMTTRAKGTGLGLAIVKRIMQDHSGNIQLSDAPPQDDGSVLGAQVTLIFSRDIKPGKVSGNNKDDNNKKVGSV